MDQSSLQSALKPFGLTKVAYFPSVGSTNDIVAAWARAGVRGPALAVADEQTQGRGRSGRRWFTPPGSALAFSLLLPNEAINSTAALGRASGLGALAVCEALEAVCGLQAKIKWPNDVLLMGRKVAGVLAEAQWTGDRLTALMLGIGINIAPSSVPPAEALSFPATSIEQVSESEVERLALMAASIESCLGWLDRLEQPEFSVAWEGRLAYQGERVQLHIGQDETLIGELEGLEEDGSLILRLADGRKKAFQVGEISLRLFVDSQTK